MHKVKTFVVHSENLAEQVLQCQELYLYSYYGMGQRDDSDTMIIASMEINFTECKNRDYPVSECRMSPPPGHFTLV